MVRQCDIPLVHSSTKHMGDRGWVCWVCQLHTASGRRERGNTTPLRGSEGKGLRVVASLISPHFLSFVLYFFKSELKCLN